MPLLLNPILLQKNLEIKNKHLSRLATRSKPSPKTTPKSHHTPTRRNPEPKCTPQARMGALGERQANRMGAFTEMILICELEGKDC
jgi:hypothetical protein